MVVVHTRLKSPFMNPQPLDPNGVATIGYEEPGHSAGPIARAGQGRPIERFLVNEGSPWKDRLARLRDGNERRPLRPRPPPACRRRTAFVDDLWPMNVEF